MNNDDSFNDCDELLSLYSSKKVIDTFKAQLKKIAASNDHLTLCPEKDKKVDIPTIKKPVVECIEVSDDDLTYSPPQSIRDNSIEVITDFTPRRSTRQSARLRRARGNSEHSHLLSIPTQTQGRKRRKKGKKQKKGKPVEVTLEDSPQLTEIDDELNPEFTVKVIWKSVNVKKFQIRKFQKLSYVFEQLSNEENIPEDKVILTFNNIRVNPNDTPDSLNLQVYHFLDGGVLSEGSNSCQTPESQRSNLSEDSITLKFQDVNKKIIKLSLHKNDKLKVAMIKCSEQLEIPLSRIRFFFDGELLNPSETPETLGLENEEIVDIKISS